LLSRPPVGGIIALLLLLITHWSFAQTANFKSDVTQGCFPLTVNFTDMSTGSPNDWKWDFGNGNTSTIQNPSAVFPAPGQYNVSLTISNGGAPNTLIRSAFIVVHDHPLVDFSFDVTSGCAPLSVKFKDNTPSSSGQITTWQWVFDDGGSSTSANPAYVFNQPGNRTVSLRVKNEFGCEASKSAGAPIAVLGPLAKFSIDKTAACSLPATFQFTNQSSGNGLTYQWDFSDGLTSTSINPSHSYSNAGTFKVILKTRDNNGCEQSFQKAVNAGSEGGLDFTASPLKVCLGDPIDFTLVSDDAPINASWTFGDGGTSAVNDPTYTYSNAGTYSVTLTSLLLNHNCNSTISKTVVVAKPATPRFTQSVDCNYNLTLTSTSLNASRVEWFINDELVSGASSFISPLHSPGGQEVRLVAFDAAGCSVELEDVVSIPGSPIASVRPNKQQDCKQASLSGCAPFFLQFTNNSKSDDPLTFKWDFGDGATSTQTNPSHTFSTKGLYQVTLKATNTKGCSGDTTVFVVVANTAPFADFVIDKTIACAGEEVKFTDKSADADFYCWDFGNGDTGSGKEIIYKYPKPGTYSVTLTAKNAGCTSQKTKLNVITIKDPYVTFGVGKSCADPHTLVLTNGSTNYDEMHWDFGDGQTSSVINVGSHHYAQEGLYTLQLIGTNFATGCTTIAYEPILIQDVKADFDVNTTRPCKDSPLQFHDKSNAAFKWEWTIAGTESTLQNPATKIKVPGTYSAKLEVTDTDGCKSSKTVPITVVDMHGDFSFRAASTCEAFTVNFENLSGGTPPPTLWSWDFGDGGSSTGFEPVYVYHATGKYKVSLSVTNSDGTCTFSKEDAINFTVPVPSFETAKEIFCPGETVIAANTTKNAVTYEWDYGDGRRSDFVSPSIVYDKAGSYDLTLFAKDAFGCERKLTRNDVVTIEKPAAAFSVASSTAQCPPFTGFFTDLSQKDIEQWEWDFGDGHTSLVQNPANIYSEPGGFNVKLTVTDRNGCTDTKVADQFVTVGGPYGTFLSDGANSCTYKNVSFSANTTNATTLKWDFGDGVVQSGADNDVSHSYTSTGIFTPSLTLIDSRGCQTVAKGSAPLTVKDTTAISSIISPTCIRTDQTFTVKGSGGTSDDDLMWTWKVGDVTLGTGSNVQAAIPEPGLHVVRGLAINKSGCVSNTVDTVRIQGPITFIPNVITPNGDVANETFRIIGLENSIWNIDIVNRWGSVVYRKDGYNGEWDAGDQPAGVYYYVLRNSICEDVTYKGYITVAK
jgi:gliding motility-associated-like protein